MEKLREVIKFFCKKGMPHMEIHEDFIENLGKESTYSIVKNGQQRGRGGVGALRMMNGLAAPKMPTLMKMSTSYVHTLVMCDGRQDLQSIARKVVISFGAVQ